MQRNIPKYQKIKKIGEGSYGEVYLANLSQNIQGRVEQVAIKQFKFSNFEEGFPATALREISILKSLDHPNIIQLREILTEDEGKSVSIVMDYMDLDLAKFLDLQRDPLSDSKVKTLMYQILSGL